MTNLRHLPLLAPPLDGEGLGWGDANEVRDISGCITPTQPTPIEGEGFKSFP